MDRVMSSGVGLLLYHCMAKFFAGIPSTYIIISTCVALVIIIFNDRECNLVLLVVTYKIMSCLGGGGGWVVTCVT